jgi:hypothetical protein
MDIDLKSDKVKRFLDGLTKLTRETGVVISGCGCCGSPYLYEDTAAHLLQHREYRADGNSLCEKVVEWCIAGDD